MLEPADEVLHFSRSELSARHVDGLGAAEGRLSSEQPLGRGVTISLEQLESSPEKSRSAQKAIRFIGRKPALLFAACERSGRQLQPLE